MINALDLVAPKHYMYGLLEVDVTLARQLIAAQKAQTGEAFSFTAFLVYCLARAVAENKEVQAYLKGRKQLVLFEDVNVGKVGINPPCGGMLSRGQVTRLFGKFTGRSAWPSPGRCRPAEGCRPGSVLRCCFPGRCRGW